MSPAPDIHFEIKVETITIKGKMHRNHSKRKGNDLKQKFEAEKKVRIIPSKIQVQD